jgi:GTP-dependent phosphoenolpyruvate carboxykinase
MLEHQGLCGDGTYTTWTEQLREDNEEVDGEDEEFAHGANRTMTANARKTAPHRRIPSYCEFATDTCGVRIDSYAEIGVRKYAAAMPLTT